MNSKRLLIVTSALFLAFQTNVFAKTDVINKEGMLNEVSNNWEDNYYEKITINDGKAEMDGEKIDLSKELNITEKEEKNILSSEQYAKDYFEKQDEYEVRKRDGNIEITSPYQTHRIIVNAIIKNTYGADSVYYDKEYEQTILQFSSDEAAKKACEAINVNKKIAFPDSVIKTEGNMKTLSVNNLKDAQSWGVKLMGLDTLKNKANDLYPDRKVLVAVLDTGYNSSNFLIAGKKISSKSKSFIKNDTSLTDKVGHGSHVSGTIAEGTSKHIELLECKITDMYGTTTDYLISEGLKYAIAQKADVANMSVGGYSFLLSTESPLEPVCKKAYNNDMIMVAAAGNESSSISHVSPANSDKTWAITAMDETELFADYSNYGKEADFCAPGSNIWGSARQGKYTLSLFSGTSMAAPHITSAAAMIKLKCPNCSVQKAYNELKSLCKDYGPKGKDNHYGWGVPILTHYYDTESAAEEKKTVPAAPKITSVKIAGNKATIQWTKGTEGTQYIVHFWNELLGDTDTKIKTKNNSCTYTIPYAGLLHKCYVESYQNGYYSNDSNRSPMLFMKTPKLKVKVGKRQIKLQNKSLNYAKSKVEILLATNKSFKKAKKYAFGKNKSIKVIKKLKSRKKYYVKIREIRKVSGKSYASPWTKTKVAKVK